MLAVTSATDAPLGALAVVTLLIPAATKHRRDDEPATVQPLSSLFDQCTHIVLDVVCLVLAQRHGVDNARAVAAHANTE